MKNKNHKYLAPEAVVILLCVGCLVFAMRNALFFGTTTLTHDNLYWDLPIFSYFAEGVRHGVLPLWNPYTHGGEPLLPAYLQLRMFDPLSLVTAWFGQFFTDDLITLFSWDRLVKAVVGAMGVYILLRQWTSSRLVRYSLIPIVLWSSLTLTSFNQNGILDEFYCAPYIAWFVFRILYARDYRLRNWVGAGISFGVCLQSYFFVGPLILVTFLLAGFALARWHDLAALFRKRRNLFGAGVAVMALLMMSGPNLIMFLTKSNYDFVARNLPAGWESMKPNGGPFAFDLGPQKNVPDSLIMPYKMIYYSGTFESAGDFAGLLVPPIKYLEDHNTDALQFLGALTLLGALIGMVSGRHPLKSVWAVVAIGFGLLILGPYGGLHWFLYKIYPPLWFIRHTHLLVNFFLMAVLYFYLLGAEFVLQWYEGYANSASKKDSQLIQRSGKSKVARGLAQFVVYSFAIGLSVIAVSWYPSRVGDISPIPFIFVFLVFLLWSFRSMLDKWHMVATIIYFLITMALMNTEHPLNTFTYLLFALGMPVLLVLVSGMSGLRTTAHVQTAPRAPGETPAKRVSEAVSRTILLVLITLVCMNIIRLFGHYGYYGFGAMFFLSAILLAFVSVARRPQGGKSAIGIASQGRDSLCRIALTGILASLSLPLVTSINLFEKFVPDQHLAGATVWGELVLSAAVLALKPSLLSRFVERFRSDRDFDRIVFRTIFFFIFPWFLVSVCLMVFSQPRFTTGVLAVLLLFGYVVISLIWSAKLYVMYSAVYSYAWRLAPALARIPGGSRRVVPYFLLAFLAFDLLAYVNMASFMWTMPRPDKYLTIPKAAASPRLPDTREPIPQIKASAYEDTHDLVEPIRYSGLLSRQATALDFPRSFPTYPYRNTTFDEVLKSERWNSFTMPLSYSRLIHSGLTSVILKKIFAIGEPLLQYRPNFVHSDEFIKLMGAMTPRQALRLLARSVIIGGSPANTTGVARHLSTDKFSNAKIVQTGYRYNSINLDVHVPGNGYLYYADGYDRYWRAYVNGREVPVHRADGAFKAIPVTSSARHVEFVYDPKYLIYVIVLFEATFFIGVAVILGSYVRDARRK